MLRKISALMLLAMALIAPLACSNDDDPVSNSTTTTPTSAASMIGANGGTVALTSGALAGSSVSVPAGALASNTMISLAQSGLNISGAGQVATGPAVEFTPNGQTFSASVSVTIPYRTSILPAGVMPSQLMVAKRNTMTNVTTLITPSSVDTNAQTLTVSTSSFSIFQAIYVVPNQAPNAVNDVATVVVNMSKTINVLTNDSDPDGTNLSLTAVTQPSNATVSIAGNLIQVVAGSSVAVSSFTYTVSDGQFTDTATVTLGVVPADAPLSMVQIGTYRSDLFGAGVAEISAYDAASKRLFVVNGNDERIDVLDLADPTNPTFINSLNVKLNNGRAANSVAVKNGIVAIAVEQIVKQDNGQVIFYSAETLGLLASVTAGALPDMLSFTPDGRTVVVANEGEPSDDYTVDPVGSITIIDLPNDITSLSQANVRTAGFAAFDNQILELRAAGVRIFGPGASVSQDLEPEYIAVSADSNTAWVSLQENNAFAIVDLVAGSVTQIKALGYKDHSKTGFGLDASDRDAPGTTSGFRTNITTWPVWGMYQPDSIASYAVAGSTYIVSANEGDARAYGGFDEEARIKDLNLDPSVFPVTPGAGLEPSIDGQLGRLRTTTASGDANGDGMYEALYSYGARSFSIWDAAGELVWDSGDFIERYIAINYPEAYNLNDDAIVSESRSDDKGPEPEALTVAAFNGRWFAFIGLERQGGIFVFDITSPTSPRFVQYTTNRNLTPGLDCEANIAIAGDIGPEGMLWISAADSPWFGMPLVVVSNEVSGSVTIYAALGDSNYSAPVEQDLTFVRETSYTAQDTAPDTSAAEIVGFDSTTKRIFTVNAANDRIDVTLLSNGAGLGLTLVQSLSVDAALSGGSPNSLAIHNGVMAVAIENGTKGLDGVVAFYDTTTLALLSTVPAGVLPDMVTFTPNGSKVLVANEGESFDDGVVIDPEGSVTVIDVSGGAANLGLANVTQLNFNTFDSQRASLISAGVRIYDYAGTSPTVSQALEPEYIAITSDSLKAIVSLQEANAFAIIDLATLTISDIHPLGFIDHSLAGFGLDASDRDSFGTGKRVMIQNWPLMGALMPDTVKAFKVNGVEYVISANEGDAREIGGYAEDDNAIKDVSLDPTLFPATWAAYLHKDASLGRLGTWENTNDRNGDGMIDVLTGYGSRSTTIFRADNGDRVWDSGDLFERVSAMHWPSNFNASNTSNALDNRSDNKGPEPEAVEVGVINGTTYAFIAMERQGNIVVLDLNKPSKPRYVTTLAFRNYAIAPDGVDFINAGDNGPESIVFVPSSQSPNGKPLLIVGNETSGSTAVWSIGIK